jgi:hypothetical protein
VGERPRTADDVTRTVLVTVALLAALAPGAALQPASPLEVVATGVPRPLQLIRDGDDLVVLAAGEGAAAAGELRRFSLGAAPADVSRLPVVRIAFADTRQAALGSLALDPTSRTLFLGEENGQRIWGLGDGGRLTLYAAGLHRLAGGSTLAVDGRGRLLVVDHADPRLATPEDRTPPGLEEFREEEYRGPLVFRLALERDVVLPRPLDRLTPFFPRPADATTAAVLPRLVAVAPLPGGRVAVVTSAGQVLRIGEDRRAVPHARLPAGQYVRISVAAATDGSLYVSGGFWLAAVFAVAADGGVRTLASGLADPQGIALDRAGRVYVAESSLHRIVRLPAP